MDFSSVSFLRLLGCAAILVAWWPVVAARPRGSAAVAVGLTVLIGLAMLLHARWVRVHARRAIADLPLPAFLQRKLREAHPQLDDAAARQVERGLRQFFSANALADGQFVAMPSKVVDTLWHEFILHTRAYEAFCRRAFGRLLHHTPAEALPAAGTGRRAGQRREGLRRAWAGACRDEGIDPRKPDRLPLLFALDATLGIAGGYVYALDCALLGSDRGGTHCASDLGGGSSGCGGGGDGGSAGGHGSGDAAGDGGGDGGGGGCGGD